MNPSEQSYSTTLIFPPSLLAETPPVSIAALTAYLRARGMKIYQHDWNATFNRYLLDKVELEAIRGNVPGNKSRQFLKQFFLHHVNNNYFKDTQFKLWPSSYECEPGFESISTWDPPFPFSYCEFLDDLTKNPELVFSFLQSPQNVYHNFYDEVGSGIVNQSSCIGFSIIGYTQVIPSLTLGLRLKQENPSVHICWGGPWVTTFAEIFMTCLDRSPELGKLVDSLIVREGEEPFHLLASKVGEGRQVQGILGENLPAKIRFEQEFKPQGRRRIKELEKITGVGIPNLHWKNESGLFHRSGNISWVADIEKLPTPDYSDFDFNDYTQPNFNFNNLRTIES